MSTHHDFPDHSPGTSFSFDRISQLVSDLEQELALAPANSHRVMALRHELAMIKRTLAESKPEEDKALESEALRQQLHGTHGKLDDLIASMEGEILRDTPYLTELGRILGLM
jgi:hypothetical protein